ncbi:MAG: Gfo/Idh/MocA family oxidoreductase [Lactobacillus sp.]|jgi:predicted dehydrogenase|nr:Gfo/Idh/MocA family oxidoreductase [Lactobacillus sp.]
MLKIGLIGTNWLTKQFVAAIRTIDYYQLTALYSRKLARAQEFGVEINQELAYFDNLTAFLASDLDVIYIATPNSLHFQQVKLALEAGKHVIVEKPAFDNPQQMQAIQEVLQAHPGQYLFEAARHIHEPNFQAVTKAIAAFDHQDGAVLTYMKYSSKFDAFLKGDTPNIFTKEFAGGALQDLGVYLVYDAVSWFGVPEKVQYTPTLLRTGIDGRGTAVLTYPDFQVTLNTGKNVQSHLVSEIYSGKQTITIDNAGEFNQVTLTTTPGADPIVLSQQPDDNPMIHEAQAFGDFINNHDQANFERLNSLSINVNHVLYNLRRSAGIVFPADEDGRK